LLISPSEFEEEENMHKSLKQKYKPQKSSKVPAQIQFLMGEVNLKYIVNEIEEVSPLSFTNQQAERIAKEIICQYPTFQEPYNLLG